jgi:Uncharacterized protein conserved in bacteria C-term(DUF2220)
LPARGLTAPALTASALSDYRALKSLQAKESFDAVMANAQHAGAIRLHRPRYDPTGLIERIDLVDAGKLAGVLGEVLHLDRVQLARQQLLALTPAFPVLEEVLERWDKLKKARGTGPEDAAAWCQAAAVVDYCRGQVAGGESETPVRDSSARLFRDSKVIESLISQLDALLCGSLDAPARQEAEVLQELGLFREPQPARLAGLVSVRRDRVSSVLDRPYTALPPAAVLGLASVPSQVLTVENLTTFHVTARRLCDTDVLVLYTAGMPSPAWQEMYSRLLGDVPVGTPICHWGDVDEGGFRIAAFLSRAAAATGHQIQPWKMAPGDVPEAQRRPAAAPVIERMVKFAQDAGWADLARQLATAGIVAEQEG